MSHYPVPSQPVIVEEVIKNSQFITRLQNVTTAEAAKAFIKSLNQQFPDATHHCWAYIVGNPESTTLLGCSDDGEPSGTAGKPMLNVLQHAGVGDIVAVCTRYYGGTKLGTGGLQRAYGGGVKLAMEQLVTQVKINYVPVELAIEYAQLKDCEHLLKDFEIRQYQLQYLDQIQVEFELAEEQTEAFTRALTNMFKGQVEWSTTD